MPSFVFLQMAAYQCSQTSQFLDHTQSHYFLESNDHNSESPFFRSSCKSGNHLSFKHKGDFHPKCIWSPRPFACSHSLLRVIPTSSCPLSWRAKHHSVICLLEGFCFLHFFHCRLEESADSVSATQEPSQCLRLERTSPLVSTCSQKNQGRILIGLM